MHMAAPDKKSLRILEFDRTDQLMAKLHRSLRRNYDRQLKNFGLTPCQFEVLMTLWSEDGIVLGELRRRVSRDGPTITGVVDRMEKKMLVKRTRDPHDRRVVKVHLTSKGENMKEDLERTKKQVMEKITKSLSLKDMNLLVSLMEKMMRNVEREGLVH
jgi:DNA-binding MarR family transcriptional regulator